MSTCFDCTWPSGRRFCQRCWCGYLWKCWRRSNQSSAERVDPYSLKYLRRSIKQFVAFILLTTLCADWSYLEMSNEPPLENRPSGFTEWTAKAFYRVSHLHDGDRLYCTAVNTRQYGDPCKVEACFDSSCHSVAFGPENLSTQVCCSCPRRPHHDAMALVQFIPPGQEPQICLIKECDSQWNVCGGACCDSKDGIAKICAKTKKRHDTNRSAHKPPESNTSVARNGTWWDHMPICVPNKTAAWRTAYGACLQSEVEQMRNETNQTYRDCLSSNWALCCPGEPNCSPNCHDFQLKMNLQKTAIVCGSMVALFLVVRLLSSAWFWREIASRYPDTRAVPAAEAGRPRRKVTVNDFRVCLVLCWSKGLKTAANDAKAVKAKFEKGSYDEVFLLMDDDLTDEKIGQAIKTIIGLCSGHQWPLIVVYYAGHGRSKQEADQLLCSRQQPLSAGPHSWYDLKDMVDMFGSMHTRAGMDDLGLQNAPEPVKNADVLCILDCCREEDPEEEQFGREYVKSVREDYDDLRPRRRLNNFDSCQELPRAAKIGFIWSAKRGHVAKDQTREGSRHSPFAAPFLDFMLDPINLCDLFQAIKEKVFEEVGLYIDQLGLADNVTLAPLNAQEQTRATRLLPLVGFERSELASMLTHEDV